MNFLLDTHVRVWSQQGPDRLGYRTKRLFLAAENEVRVCTVSILEIARLVATGAIELSIPLREWIDRALSLIGARTVPGSHDIVIEAYALPGRFHKDPADRVLVAAARCHELDLVTADERIRRYRGIRTCDAGC